MAIETVTIDHTYLHSLTGGDKSFEKKLLEEAVRDIEIKIGNLHQGWKEQNAENICSNAHALKSLTAIAGIPQIQNWCKIIEQLFSRGIQHSSLEIENIINAWPIAKAQLLQILETH